MREDFQLNAGEYPSIPYSEIVSKCRLILKPETSFYIIAIVYGVGASFLSLAIPVSVQSLVNSVTFGVLFQPLFTLSIVLLALLGVFGALNALQTYVIEIFQRRFFARMGSEITLTLLNANPRGLEERNGVELVNRYFDVMTVQKNVTILLTGASSVLLQTFAGLLLLAFYHPYFLAFDFILLGMLLLVWKLFGKKALSAAVMESKAKYRFARWLEEISAANLFFKTRNRYAKTAEESDQRINQYLKYRRMHFRNLFFQIVLLLLVYAVMSSVILGLGGFLVIKGQLALGQLVAAELVATVILGGLAKSGKYLESFYDLYAAVEKLSEFYEVPSDVERVTKVEPSDPFDLVFSCAFSRAEQHEFVFNHRFARGTNTLVRSERPSAKIAFLQLARGIIPAQKGKVEIGGVNVNDISQLDLMELIYCIERPVVLETTIYENLTFGKKNIPNDRIKETLELVGLGRLESDLPCGLGTKLLASGYPLWSSDLIKLEIARALLANPKVLILTEGFDQISNYVRGRIIDYLVKSEITFILVSEKEVHAEKFQETAVIGRSGMDA